MEYRVIKIKTNSLYDTFLSDIVAGKYAAQLEATTRTEAVRACIELVERQVREAA